MFENFLSFFDSLAMFADDVKNGSRYELEGLNEEMAKEYEETKKLISRTKGNFTKAVNRLNRQRLDISNTTLKAFVENFSKLKHIEFDDVIVSIRSVLYSLFFSI